MTIMQRMEWKNMHRSRQRSVALSPILFCLMLEASCTGFSKPSSAPFFLVDEISRAELDFDREMFRSVRKDGRVSGPMTLKGVTRESLTPPLPSQIAFTVDLPARPVFAFAVGAASLGSPALPAPVDFRVGVDHDGETHTVFSHTVPRREADRWTRHRIDLSSWQRETVRLTFEASAPGGAQAVIPAWGNPVIVDAAHRASTKPPLVLISVDCLRPDHLGAYGYERDISPNIDALADEGTVFDVAVATSSWTLPTHMSMLTGLAPSLHGASKWSRLSDSVPYLPELLTRAAYDTHGITSWVYLSQAFGFERGFRVYRNFEEPNAEDIVDAAVQALEPPSPEPLFLFLHLFDPHWPYLPPKEFIGTFAPRPRDISDLMDRVSRSQPPGDEKEIQELIDLYDGEIAFADREIGRLLDELASQGLYDRSLIILTADHGEAFFEHGHWQHSETLHEEVIRIPLIVKWPKNGDSTRREGRTRRVAVPVSQADIFPTLAEAAGLAIPTARSLRHHVDSKAISKSMDPVVSEITWMAPERTSMKIGLRTTRLKYVAELEGPPGDPLGASDLVSETLYDLELDPEERENVVDRRAGAAKEFRAQMRVFLAAAKTAREDRTGAPVMLDDAMREKLKSLGYLHD